MPFAVCNDGGPFEPFRPNLVISDFARIISQNSHPLRISNYCALSSQTSAEVKSQNGTLFTRTPSSISILSCRNSSALNSHGRISLGSDLNLPGAISTTGLSSSVELLDLKLGSFTSKPIPCICAARASSSDCPLGVLCWRSICLFR